LEPASPRLAGLVVGEQGRADLDDQAFRGSKGLAHPASAASAAPRAASRRAARTTAATACIALSTPAPVAADITSGSRRLARLSALRFFSISAAGTASALLSAMSSVLSARP